MRSYVSLVKYVYRSSLKGFANFDRHCRDYCLSAFRRLRLQLLRSRSEERGAGLCLFAQRYRQIHGICLSTLVARTWPSAYTYTYAHTYVHTRVRRAQQANIE